MVQDVGARRLSVSLPSPLVKEFDTVWKSMKYTDRSKAVHDAIRNFITEHKWMQEEADELMGALVLLYYFDKPDLLNAVMRIQHEFEDIIASSMHVHLTKDKCLEIIAVKGKAEHVKNLMQKLMAKKGVKQVKLAAIAP
ncbi:MAG TPA: nickel-responsive transcriptional regulator NikR [Candidatus Bathyarchaeia archaeon]|nr:nickel-responsive transcriptional regulator NikR [Candidatus Bathyarchaeia archaeon]